MSEILLPAVRRRGVNLLHYALAGEESRDDTSPIVYGAALGSSVYRASIADMGLAIGDAVSASAEVKNETANDDVRLEIRFRDSSENILSDAVTSYVDSQAYTRLSLSSAVPADTATIELQARRQSGSGFVAIRAATLNAGASAQDYEHPKRGAWAPITHGLLMRDNEQITQRLLTGTSQVTVFPSRLWMLEFATHVLEGDELREWDAAIDQLSDLKNTFRFVPPRYTGPSTGYDGPLPLVDGADQLGRTLNVKNLDASTPILKRGDYVSFEWESVQGETNVSLHKIAADVTSDGSGEATLAFTTPIRNAPDNNEPVQIYSPTGMFRFVAPQAGVDTQLLRRAAIRVQAEEAVWP